MMERKTFLGRVLGAAAALTIPIEEIGAQSDKLQVPENHALIKPETTLGTVRLPVSQMELRASLELDNRDLMPLKRSYTIDATLVLDKEAFEFEIGQTYTVWMSNEVGFGLGAPPKDAEGSVVLARGMIVVGVAFRYAAIDEFPETYVMFKGPGYVVV